MAKRLTDTEKWKKRFFRGLQAPYKLVWIYLLDDCNHAGIWNVEFDVLKLRTGISSNEEEILKVFEGKIIPIDDGYKWYIPDFIEFQYGTLNENNRVHLSVIDLLNKYNIKPLTSPLQGVKDKDKDKDKDKEKDPSLKYNIFIEIFNKLTERKFKGDSKSKTQFGARVKDGYNYLDFEKAIINAMNDDYIKENPKYLTPEYITRSNQIEKWLNIPVKKRHPNDQPEKVDYTIGYIGEPAIIPD